LTDVRLRRARLVLTALEQRCVPAVTATFVSGNLAVTGDDGNNDITLTQAGAGMYRVDGLTGGSRAFSGVNYIAVNAKGGTDTVTLNGGGQNFLLYGATVTGAGTLTVVNNKFNIGSLGGFFTVSDAGPNNVSVFIQAGTSLGRGFSVTTGAGNDSVAVGPGAAVYGPALLRLGDDTNSVTFTGALVDGALTVAAGAGSNTVELTNTKLGNINPGSLDINVGAADTVKLTGLAVNGNGQVMSGNGTLKLDVTNAMFKGHLDVAARQVTTQFLASTIGDWLRLTTDATNNTSGTDSIGIRSCKIWGDFRVQTGTNFQYLNVQTTTISGDATVSGRGGALFLATGSTVRGGLVVDYQAAPANASAEIRLTRTWVKGALAITTGAGDDQITLNDALVGLTSPSAVATINTGGGNDTVDLSSSTFYCNALFDGGPGSNHLRKGGARFLESPPIVIHFEING
jgi:hypothetical protein